MTNMENLQPKLDEQARQDQAYETAMRSIQAANRNTERQGYASNGRCNGLRGRCVGHRLYLAK